MIAKLSVARARRLWIRAQRLDEPEPFGSGPDAVKAAVEHLGYVQIDTIHVIERAHHHILQSRIPGYARADLRCAQAVDKSVFEYWTHALAYVPTRDYAFFVGDMARLRKTPNAWHASVTDAEVTKVLRRIRTDGALSIRDIDDDVRVEKKHPWGSTKPSKRALERAFHDGRLVVGERLGMVKTYELAERHFGWKKAPRAAKVAEVVAYKLERALRSQAFVSLDSVCHLDAKTKPALKKILDARAKKGELVEVRVEGAESAQHWARPEVFDAPCEREHATTHLLSPFDPLVIQRKRLAMIFGHDHRFEAYVPKEKRVYGYFALPVLVDDELVALVDLKADRERRELLVQRWSWLPKRKSAEGKRRIEEALGRFEAFQLAR